MIHPLTQRMLHHQPNEYTQFCQCCIHRTVSTALSDTGRSDAGCGTDKLGNIYVVGGRSRSSFWGANTVDVYSIDDDSWSVIGQNVPRKYTRCVPSAFSSRIECAGGVEVPAQTAATCTDSVVYTSTTGPVSVALATPVFSAGVENYVIDAGTIGGYGASVILVIGGSDSSPLDAEQFGTDLIQYAVRYEMVTSEPTSAPTPTPTADTDQPSPAPSRSPLMPGETFPPTNPPTTALPTTADDSSAARCNVNFLCLIAVFAMLYV